MHAELCRGGEEEGVKRHGGGLPAKLWKKGGRRKRGGLPELTKTTSVESEMRGGRGQQVHTSHGKRGRGRREVEGSGEDRENVRGEARGKGRGRSSDSRETMAGVGGRDVGVAPHLCSRSALFHPLAQLLERVAEVGGE